MKEHNRLNPRDVQPRPDADSDDGDSAADDLTATRAEADRLVAAAGNVFQRIWASDSQAFLSQGRQTGGE